MYKKFKRNSNNVYVGGVCSGIADYTCTDVVLWRLIFLFGTLFTVFTFILIYLVLWIALPSD